MMRYIISYEKTVQVAEDSWRVSLRTLIASEHTTLREIRDWYIKDNNFKAENAKVDDLKISDPVDMTP